MDARPALSRISAPTLVVHRQDSFTRVEFGRYLGEQIEGAKLVIFPGRDHFVWVEAWEPIVDEIEEFLTGARHRVEPDRALATILFTDIASSTERVAELGDERWRALLERHDEVTRAELERYGGRVIKSLGDGFLAAFEGPAKAIRCARAICAEVRPLGIELRAGVHTGECELRGEDLAGVAVHVGARIGALAQPSEVLVSSTVRELVLGSGIEFIERGTHALKGVPGEWRLYAMSGDGRTDARPVSEVDPKQQRSPLHPSTPCARATARCSQPSTERLAQYGHLGGRPSAFGESRTSRIDPPSTRRCRSCAKQKRRRTTVFTGRTSQPLWAKLQPTTRALAFHAKRELPWRRGP